MSAVKSRWADDAEEESRRRREKEEKKRLKLEKQRKQEQEAEQRRERDARDAAGSHSNHGGDDDADDAFPDRPAKRRRTSRDADTATEQEQGTQAGEHGRPLLRFEAPGWGPCRHVSNFEPLNHIEEGSYGWVSRARELATGEVVALKKLKMDGGSQAAEGFPVTALREIRTLQAARHPHVVALREVVIGGSGGDGDGDDNARPDGDVYIVMEFVEHDLRTLADVMAQPFSPSEVKTLVRQLCGAVAFLHSHWILHRDIKASNILLSNRGEAKLADFGMARFTGDPPPPDLTQLVVTLWYRAPELLLGARSYGPAVDVWSLGCVFGELLRGAPVLQGRDELDQVSLVLALTGLPTESSYPGFRRLLPNARSLRLPPDPPPHMTTPSVRAAFPFLTAAGADLLSAMLALNPDARPSAARALEHRYFAEEPRPKPKEMFPTYPSKASLERRRRARTPSAPRRGEGTGKVDLAGLDVGSLFNTDSEEGGGGFQLRMGR